MAKMASFEKFFVNSWWDKVFHKYFGIGKLLKNIPDEKFDSILEIGAGVGITTGFIQEKFPKARIIATDYDPQQVEEAKIRLAGSGIVVEEADATQLGFADNSFDACFAILTFHHVENFPKAIIEVCRVLKPGGKFYIIDIPGKNWTLSHLRIYKSMGITPGLFSKQELEDIVRRTGFEILNSQGKGMFKIIAQKL